MYQYFLQTTELGKIRYRKTVNVITILSHLSKTQTNKQREQFAWFAKTTLKFCKGPLANFLRMAHAQFILNSQYFVRHIIILFYNLSGEKILILVLLVLFFKSKLLYYSFRVSKYLLCLQGI